MKKRNQRNENGFTLIELLVVIVVVAILAALGLPAYNNAMSRADSTKCAGNLRQIGIAIDLYAADNNGAFPRAKNWDAGIGWPEGDWNYQISEYCQTIEPGTSQTLEQWAGGIFRCPGKKDWSIEPGSTDAQRVSYSMNAFTTTVSNTQTKVQVVIPNPSKTVLVADSGSGRVVVFNSDDMRRVDAVPRHNGGDNVLFCDGHVEWIRDGSLSYELTLLP